MKPRLDNKKTSAVKAEVDRCIKIAKTKFDVDIKPKIVYEHADVPVKAAGAAFYNSSTIYYNPWYLDAETDEFLSRTVPHEVAHLVVRALQEKNIASSRIHAHGPLFRQVMDSFGVDRKNQSEKHSYDVTSLPEYKSKYIYQCTKCKHKHALAKPNHLALVQNPARYKCVRCANPLTLIKEATL